MRISEVANLTGLNISNIRFYERKGLLSPVREEESKYRNYTEEDVLRLKQILLYRKMGISIETIYLLFHEQAELGVVLERQKTELKSQIENLQGALELCDLMLKEEKIRPEKLDEYLEYVHREEEKGKQFAQIEELLDDLAEYTKTRVFRYEPCIMWLFRKPWIARIVSVVLWGSLVMIPFINVYTTGIKGEGLYFSLLFLYGMILLVNLAAFLAFRRAVKQNLDEENSDKEDTEK